MTIEPNREVFPFTRVGITGATGTVGSVFTKVLLAQCPHVESIATVYRTPGGPRVKRLPDSPKLERLIGNVADPGVASNLVDSADIVYHLAGWLANTDLPADRNDVYITNSLSTALLARLCRRQGTRFVFTSSHSVYFAGDYAGRIGEDSFAFRRDFVNWIDSVTGLYYELADSLIDGRIDIGFVSTAVGRIHEQFPPPFEPKIYDNDGYHIYCLTKLLAERFALENDGVVLRLANVYGPGDDSLQAVGEACARIMKAKPGDHIKVLRPFKKLVPTFLGDIVKSLIRAGTMEMTGTAPPLFTMASQENYVKEDEILRAVASALTMVRGTTAACDIETLPPDTPQDFTYDLSKLRTHLLSGEELTSFDEGLAEHVRWLLAHQAGDRPATDVSVTFASQARN